MKGVREVLEVPLPGMTLTGELVVPEGAQSLVIFSHGSGSSRLSTRNMFVASVLQEHGIATFLFDLLTKIEDTIYANRYNIPKLTSRLLAATDFLARRSSTKPLSFGYFGASTGAASALCAAIRRPRRIQAVVSRGGRPDLSGDGLRKVHAATLLIVGSRDKEVLELNEKALAMLPGPKSLAVLPHASHVFEEPGALKQVANLAVEWFTAHLHPVAQAAT